MKFRLYRDDTVFKFDFQELFVRTFSHVYTTSTLKFSDINVIISCLSGILHMFWGFNFNGRTQFKKRLTSLKTIAPNVHVSSFVFLGIAEG